MSRLTGVRHLVLDEEVTDIQPLTPCLGVDPGTGDSDRNRHGEPEMGRNRC